MCALLVSACSNQTKDTKADMLSAATEKDATQPTVNMVKDANLPKAEYSKIKLPADFPSDLPLPDDMQLESYDINAEDNAATLIGLLTGTMQLRLDGIHPKMLAAGWQANLVVPQGNQTLMHYTKSKRNIIIELNQSVQNVVAYRLNLDIPTKKVVEPKK